MKQYILALLLVVLSGCGTLSPGVFGKTSYNLEWHSETYEQDVQDFKVSVKAPAGDLVKVMSNLGYTWNADGSGFVKVNSTQDIDSTSQADLIHALGELQSDTLQSVVGILAPLVPGMVQGKTDRAAISANAETMSRQEVIDLITRMLTSNE
jgi:hypothetical protein